MKSTVPLFAVTTTRPRRTGTGSVVDAPGFAGEPTSSDPVQREGVFRTRSMVGGASAQRVAL